jgi:hypothetical protein
VVDNREQFRRLAISGRGGAVCHWFVSRYS